MGGLQDFSVSPIFLGNNKALEIIGTWLGLGLGQGGKGFGDRA